MHVQELTVFRVHNPNLFHSRMHEKITLYDNGSNINFYFVKKVETKYVEDINIYEIPLRSSQIGLPVYTKLNILNIHMYLYTF